MKKDIAILYSGGLDSYLMYELAKIINPNDNINCYYFNYGNKICKAEMAHLPNFVQVRNLDWYNLNKDLYAKVGEESKGKLYIPGRNLVFITLIACQELPDEIWLGSLANEIHETATDKNYIFLNKLQDTLNYTLSPFKKDIKIRFPFAEMNFDKNDLVEWSIKNKLNIQEIFNNTFTCFYSENLLHCGACHSCFRKYLLAEKFNLKLNFEINHIAFEKYILLQIENILKFPNKKDLYYDIEWFVVSKIFPKNEKIKLILNKINENSF